MFFVSMMVMNLNNHNGETIQQLENALKEQLEDLILRELTKAEKWSKYVRKVGKQCTETERYCQISIKQCHDIVTW